MIYFDTKIQEIDLAIAAALDKLNIPADEDPEANGAPVSYEVLGRVVYPRESSFQGKPDKYLADPESGFKVTISDKMDLSILHVFSNEIEFDALDVGRGDGKKYAASAEITAVVYASKRLRGFYPYLETLLARSAGVTLVKAHFDGTEIREKYLFLEKDINHDRELFAITYKVRANTCDRRNALLKL